MDQRRFVQQQRKGVNAVFVVFAILATVMWVATLFDQVFKFGWGWDPQILWLAPPMLLFAIFVRFCCMAVFRLVDGAFNGS